MQNAARMVEMKQIYLYNTLIQFKESVVITQPSREQIFVVARKFETATSGPAVNQGACCYIRRSEWMNVFMLQRNGK